LHEIANKTGYSFAQILISWAIRRGTSPVPKSATPSRIIENFIPVELTDEDFEAIDTLTEKYPERAMRYVELFDISWDVPKHIGAGIFEY